MLGQGSADIQYSDAVGRTDPLSLPTRALFRWRQKTLSMGFLPYCGRGPTPTGGKCSRNADCYGTVARYNYTSTNKLQWLLYRVLSASSTTSSPPPSAALVHALTSATDGESCSALLRAWITWKYLREIVKSVCKSGICNCGICGASAKPGHHLLC